MQKDKESELLRPLRRRDIIAMLGSAAAVMAWSGSARTQEKQKRPRVGVLTLTAAAGTREAAFLAGLSEFGYVPGRNIDIEYRYAAGDVAKLTPLAEELLALKLDVAFAEQPRAARAIKSAAPELPIVCSNLLQNMPDLYQSFSHPGGSVTGLAEIVEGMNAKLVEFAAELLPAAKSTGLIDNPSASNHDEIRAQIETAARTRGLSLQIETVTTMADLAPALDRLARNGPQPVVIPNSPLIGVEGGAIAKRALLDHLPTIFQLSALVSEGGLMSYGIDLEQSDRRAAVFVDKILKGATPGDLPIEFPTRLHLAINLRTAKALGVTVPPILIATADEVIE